jgi:hypothetical protein
MKLVFLDTGPLGVITNPKGTPEALACQHWVRDLLAAKVRVVVPAIADYELRRELIRAGKIAGLRRLDAVRMGLEFDPITQAALDRAAELWAVVRTGGQPTAAYEALDGDSILAVQALLARKRRASRPIRRRQGLDGHPALTPHSATVPLWPLCQGLLRSNGPFQRRAVSWGEARPVSESDAPCLPGCITAITGSFPSSSRTSAF